MKIITLTALLIFGTQSSASAFTLISNQITAGWNTRTLSFDVNETSCTAAGVSVTELNAAIDAAVELWNKSPNTGIKISRGSVVTTTTNTNPPTIYCNSTAQSDGVAGVGSISQTTGGHPSLGSLYLNGDSSKGAYFGNIGTTLQTLVVAHEMGHVLGLGHSEQQYALMYYDLSSKENSNLSQDDMDGLAWLNPKDEFSNGTMGCATIKSIGDHLPPSGGNGAILINWMLLILVAFGASRYRNGSNGVRPETLCP